MNSLIEQAKNFLPKKKKTRGAQWDGSEDYKYTEWYSPDRTRCIFLKYTTDVSGSLKIKDVSLCAITPLSEARNTMMRLEEITHENASEVIYNIYVDVISENPQNPRRFLDTVMFSTFSDGKKTIPSLRVLFPLKNDNTKSLSDEEFRRQCIQKLNGILFSQDELPAEIDVEATGKAFIAQIERINFSRPKLFLKQASITEYSVPLIE